MCSNPSYVPAIIAAAGVIGGTYCAYQIYQSRKKRLPENWTRVGTLQDLYTFPIKSCAPVVMQEAECTHLGLKDFWLQDRVLMVVDDKMNFINARNFPEMLLIRPTISNCVLTLTHTDMPSISVNLAAVASTKNTLKATVWGVPVPVYDCGKEVAEWLSKLLHAPNLKLVYYATQDCRQLRDKTNKVVFKFTKNDTGAFPDETSFNLINEASIEDLNKRLNKKVTHKYFRPNFVLAGAKPLDEDNWKYIKIGDNVFEIIKPCVRCVLTTIDPETGIRDSQSEPLETLRRYRLAEEPEVLKAVGNSPRMGVQMALRSPPGGKIKLNDPIYVSY